MKNILKVTLNEIISIIISFIKEIEIKEKFKFIIIIALVITFNSCFLLEMPEDTGRAATTKAADIKGAFLLAGQSNMEGNVDSNLYNNILNKIVTQNGDSLKNNVKGAIKNWHQSVGVSTNDSVFDFEAQEIVRLKKENIVGNFLKTPRSDVWASFNSNTVSGLKDGFGNPIGPELTMGQYLGNKANSSISLIKLAYGGTTLYNDWLSPSAANRLGKSIGPHYTELKNKIQSIKSNPGSVNPDYSAQWKGFVWFQGENDCFDEINAQTYEANLRDLIKDVRNTIGNSKLPVVVVELNAWASGLPYGKVILAAQNAVAASDPKVEIVKSNDLSNFYHMDPTSQLIIGERVGKSMERLLSSSNTGPAGYTWCANEGESFTLPAGIYDIAYGANGKYTYQYNKSGTIAFNNNTFGDPVPGVRKSGYYKFKTVVSEGPAGYTWCAKEGGSFALPGNSDVAYGANGKYTYQYNKSGTITFNNSTFGDPVPGVVKSGYYKLGSSSQDKLNSGYYKISVKHSGKYLDVSGVSNDNGAIIHQWDWWNGDNQKWYLQSLGNGYYSLKAKHSGKFLDVSGVSQNDGANIHQWNWWNGDNQKWYLQSLGNGYYSLKAKHSGKCLEVPGASQNNGANIIQWACHGGDNQKFRFDLL